MSGFKVAKQFFEACEAGEGWGGCQEFVADDAVTSMTKIWNARWALNELGWT